jgi:hypothetical protein
VNHQEGAQRNAGDDGDCDGTVDAYCYTWTYDDGGRPIAHSRDDDCDGTSDSACSTFSYDEYGNAHQETDVTCDQALCTQWAQHGTASGGQMLDTGCDGQLDSNCEVWSLDEGRPLRLDYDHDCDETPSLPPDSDAACWTTWKYTRI